MKKVLFITYFFPPLGGAGVGRSLKFVKYLSKFGWQPIVVSASESVRYGKDYSLMKEIPNGVKVYRIGHKEITKEWGYLAKKFKLMFNYPDYYKFWYYSAIKKAREIMKNEKIDLIFSSSAPFTSHFIAMNLKKEFGIPWVADFRDPWFKNDELKLYYERFLIKPLNKILFKKIKIAERKIINTANKTIVTSWQHRQQLCKTYNIKNNSIEVITNGYDETDFDEKGISKLYPNKLTIIFVGSFYFGFKEMFLKFLKVINEMDKNIEVIIIGKAALEMKNIKEANLTCIYYIPKRKLLSLCRGGDFLFLMSLPFAKWHIPGKTFEYFDLNKPIVALVNQDGDVAKLIRKANAGFIISYEKDKMKEQLEEIFQKSRKGAFDNFQNNASYIKQFEREKLTGKLASVFDDEISLNK